MSEETERTRLGAWIITACLCITAVLYLSTFTGAPPIGLAGWPGTVAIFIPQLATIVALLAMFRAVRREPSGSFAALLRSVPPWVLGSAVILGLGLILNFVLNLPGFNGSARETAQGWLVTTVDGQQRLLSAPEGEALERAFLRIFAGSQTMLLGIAALYFHWRPLPGSTGDRPTGPGAPA